MKISDCTELLEFYSNGTSKNVFDLVRVNLARILFVLGFMKSLFTS